MISLQERLARQINTNEFDSGIEGEDIEAKRIKRLVGRILEHAVLDLAHEVERGTDLKNPLRGDATWGSGQPTPYKPLKPRYTPKGKPDQRGRKAIPHVAPHEFLFGDDEIMPFSFSWCCQVLGLDPQSFRSEVRKKMQLFKKT